LRAASRALAAAANINGGRLGMTSLTYGSRGRPERAIAFATIAGLHALAIGLILSGLGRTAVQMVFADIQGDVFDEPKSDSPPPPPPEAPTFENAVVDLGPLPDIDFTDVDDGAGTALTGAITETPTPAAQPAAPSPLPIRLVGRHRLPNTEDYYPAAKIREGIEGTSVVKMCVDADGKATGEPIVLQSSGDAGLDLGAQHVVRDGRFARAIQGERYVPNCYSFRVIFKMRRD
jgi:periplasmic protein TonB